MTKRTSKPRRAWIAVAAVAVAIIAAWAIDQRWSIVSPDAASASTAAGAGAAAGAGKGGPVILDKPLWRDLTRAQQLALAPLQGEWDEMDGARKRKWLEMSRRFASMNPEEQGRVHERMRQWIRLTPEERNMARENYSKVRKLAPGEKAASWESYKQLSSDQKRRLARTPVRKPDAAPTPSEPTIVAPTSCPPGTTRRGASCISLHPPGTLPSGPALSQPNIQPNTQPSIQPGTQPAPAPAPAPVPSAPAAAPAPADAPSASPSTPAVTAPGTAQPAATSTLSNANG